MPVWNILGIIALALLIIFFFAGKNAVFGSFTIGIIISLIIGLVYYFKGDGFNWSLAKKIVTISILSGALFEILGRATKKQKNKKSGW